MAIVSYRIYCDECDNESVLREDRMESSLWKIHSKYEHSGICPDCNETVSDEEADSPRKTEEIPFEELDAIGESGADNLRANGIVTRGDVEDASDEEILDTAWVGEKGLKSIRREV